jgi:hypothetical protein
MITAAIGGNCAAIVSPILTTMVGQTKPGRGENRAPAHPEWRGFDKFSLSITPPAAATRSSCLLLAPDRVSCCVAAIDSGFTQGTFYAFADFLANICRKVLPGVRRTAQFIMPLVGRNDVARGANEAA